MEQILKEPIQYSEGVNLKDLLSGTTDFHIDATFDNNSTAVGDPVINLYEDEDEENNSDSDDVLSGIEDSIKKQTLSSPEYKSFSDLEAIMVDCMSGGDVKLYIVEEGDGPLVPPDAVVTIHYAAYWEGEKIPFDTTLTMNFGAPRRLHLGHSCFLPGLEIGLGHVRGPAARFHLLLHPRVTWGERGILPRIRPETALFVIVLYSVEDPNAGKRFNDLPTEMQLKFDVTIDTVKSLHNQAKQLFKKRKHLKAIKNYKQANNVMCLSQVENETQRTKLNELKTKNYTNMAVCYYMLKKPKHVLLACERLEKLIDTQSNCKIMFYYGRAYEMLGKTDEAIKYYKRALRLEPRNCEIAAALAALNHRAIQDAEKEKSFWNCAFNAASEEKSCEDAVAEEEKCKVTEEKKCKVNVAEEEKCKVNVTEEEKCNVNVAEEKKSKVNVTEEKKCEVNVSEEEKCKVNVTEEKKCKVNVSEEEKCKVNVTEEKKCKVNVTEEKKCKVTEDKKCKVNVTEEKKCKLNVTDEENCKVNVTEEENWKVNVAEEKKCKVNVTQEENCKVKITEEEKCKVTVTEEKNCKVPVTENKKCKVNITEEENYKVQVTENKKCKVTEERKCKVPHDVDEDLQSTIREMCEELTTRADVVKLDMSNSLSRSQLDYVKSVTEKFENLLVLVDGEGRNRTVSIVKKN